MSNATKPNTPPTNGIIVDLFFWVHHLIARAQFDPAITKNKASNVNETVVFMAPMWVRYKFSVLMRLSRPR